jgi:HK97 family phage portal protein
MPNKVTDWARWAFSKPKPPTGATEYERGLVQLLDSLGEGFPEQGTNELRNTTFGLAYKGTIIPIDASFFYAQVPALQACIDKICNYGMQVPLRVYRSKSLQENVFDEMVVEREFPATALAWVNEDITQADLISKIMFSLLLYGNAYIIIEPTEPQWREQSGTDFSLYTTNPMYTWKVPGEHGSGEDFFLFQRAGRRIFFPKSQVIHIKNNSPFDDLIGMVPLNSIEFALKKDKSARDVLARWYDKGARVGNILQFQGEKDNLMSDDEKKKLRRQFEAEYTGRNNAFRTLVLREGQDFKPVNAATGIEQAAIATMNDTTDTIRMLYGTPDPIFDGNAKDIEKVEEMFWNSTVKPLLYRIQQQIDKSLVKRMGSKKLECRFDFSGIAALKRQNFAIMRSDVAATNTGRNTYNEVRIANGEPPYTGEFAEFGNTPLPVWMLKNGITAVQVPGNSEKQGVANGSASGGGKSTPSMTAAGSMGGRDQSATGEAQMIDEHATKVLTAEHIRKLFTDAHDILEDSFESKVTKLIRDNAE